MGDDQTVRFGSVCYSTPPGHAGTRIWCRVAGEELVITARTVRGAAEIARHGWKRMGVKDCGTTTSPEPASMYRRDDS